MTILMVRLVLVYQLVQLQGLITYNTNVAYNILIGWYFYHLYVSIKTKPGHVCIKEDVYDICYGGYYMKDLNDNSIKSSQEQPANTISLYRSHHLLNIRYSVNFLNYKTQKLEVI